MSGGHGTAIVAASQALLARVALTVAASSRGMGRSRQHLAAVSRDDAEVRRGGRQLRV